MKKTAKVDISWSAWLVGFLPVGVLLVLLVPWLVSKIFAPEVKHSTEVPIWAGKELDGMGKISRNQIVMALLAVAALAFWIFGGKVVDATAVAFAAIALMVILGVVKWDDVLTNKSAWNVLVWFATLVALADGLNRVGFVTWFAKKAAAPLSGLPPLWVMVFLTVLFFVIHYMFASITAHVTAVPPVVLAGGAMIPANRREDVRAAPLLHARDHGHPDTVCDRPFARVLRQRLRAPKGLLEARGDLRVHLPRRRFSRSACRGCCS